MGKGRNRYEAPVSRLRAFCSRLDLRASNQILEIEAESLKIKHTGSRNYGGSTLNEFTKSADEGTTLNWSKIETLLADCTKQPGASSVPNDIGLGDYGEVLKRHNGVEGFVGLQYLMLWSVEEISNLNAGYHVWDYAPDVVLLGSDGGGTAYGRDKPTGKFGSVPFVGMSQAGFKEVGASFEEFLTKLAAGQL